MKESKKDIESHTCSLPPQAKDARQVESMRLPNIAIRIHISAATENLFLLA